MTICGKDKINRGKSYEKGKKGYIKAKRCGGKGVPLQTKT